MSRRDRIIALTVVSVVGCLAPRLRGSVGVRDQEVSAATYRVVISGAASTVRCQFAAALSGPLVRDFELREAPTIGEVVINTQRDGKPASTLTAFIYCPGFGISTVEATALDGAGARTTTITPKALGTLPLKVRIEAASPYRPLAGLVFDITYTAEWLPNYLHVSWDGVLPEFQVVTARMTSSDGTIEIQLPDFLRDPLVARFPSSKGSFGFKPMRDPVTLRYIYWLAYGGPAVAASYPAELWIRAERR
jgi:hypothetical protein